MDDSKTVKRLGLTTITLFCVGFLVLAVLVSFALSTFDVTLFGVKNNLISICGLDMKFKDENPISLLAAEPIYDASADNYEPYIITITRNNDCYDISYQLVMENACPTELCNCGNNYQLNGNLIKYKAVNTTTDNYVTGTNPSTMNLIGIIDEDNDENIIEIRLWISQDAVNSDLYVSNGSGGYLTQDGKYVTKQYCSKVKLNAVAQ